MPAQLTRILRGRARLKTPGVIASDGLRGASNDRYRQPRKSEQKTAAAPDLAVNLDLRSVSRADGLCDGQSQSGTAVISRARFIHAKEPIEYVRQCRCWNPDTRIAHFEDVIEAALAGAQGNPTASRREPDRVVEQVHDDLLEPAAIATNRDRR